MKTIKSPTLAHTPGEWYFMQTRTHGWKIAVKDGNSSPITIAHVETSDEHGRLTGDQVYANARLLGSAPELLAALKTSDLSLHPADERGACLCSQCEFRQRAAAAIAKAEGRPSYGKSPVTPSADFSAVESPE
jgi:hypothetical protein